MTTTEISAVEYEKQLLADIAKLNTAAYASAREHAAAQAKVEEAKLARSDAAKSKAHGAKNADALAEKANQLWHAALARAEQAQLESEIALSERRLCEARLEQLRSTAFLELAAEAEKATTAAMEAGQALAGPLAEFLDAWQRAQQAWAPLRVGNAEHVRTIENAKGKYPGEDRIRDAVQLPNCPIPAAALAALRSVAPRPFAMYPGFTINRESEVVVEDAFDISE